MEVAAVSAARWVVGKALAPVTDGLLESWAASAGLDTNIDALKMELLYAQGMLDNVQGRDIRSPALKQLLDKLRQLAYKADDALDELEYFRIQDALDGTYHAADAPDQGCVQGLSLHARHTARNVATKLKLPSCSHDASCGNLDGHAKRGCLSCICSSDASGSNLVRQDGAKQGCFSGICGQGISLSPSNQDVQEADIRCLSKVTSMAQNTARDVGKILTCCSLPCVKLNAHTHTVNNPNMSRNARLFLCCTWPAKARHTPKLKFNRVEMSKRMTDIIEQLKPVCAKVSTILDKELLVSSILSNRTNNKGNTMNRPKTTPEIIEPKLYGRDIQKDKIVNAIAHGQYDADELTILPIIGPGGIGKTTFTQHIYKELKGHFQVSIWVCVSLNFSVTRLVKEIVKKIPAIENENKNASDEELIELRLKSKRFLLVLDDIWACHEDQWKQLLAPLRKGGDKGNMVVVTTRIPEVAKMVKTIDCPVELDRLEPEDFMQFFEACIFGRQQPWKDHPKLLNVGTKIVGNLKGIPLAAKTVGRLLRNQLTLDHWVRVLESKEWELQTNDNDIMPALKLSYDYLPFHLQQCFLYCSLFPEDYEFGSEELVHLWIGLGILQSGDGNKTIEDVGTRCLDDLVNYGFFIKKVKKDGCPYYVMHDLLHDLSIRVSSHECLSISSSNVRSIQIPPSIRYLSIIVDDTDVSGISSFEGYKMDLSALNKRLKVQNLHTLMLFGRYHGNFVKTFGFLFRKASALRTIFLSAASYSLEDLLQKFSKLVHLRYLRIKSLRKYDMYINSDMSRFYHLEVLDLEDWQGFFGSTRHMSNLVKLRHFVVPNDKLHLHSDISEVGKLKCFRELRRFVVGKESKGFELSQLRKLAEIGGSLGIFDLENVQTTEKVNESILMHKSHLRKLTLQWNIDPSNNGTTQELVLESLVPHVNLEDLSIKGHRGTDRPKWLGANLSVKTLKSLCLDDLSWENLPLLGELWMVNELGIEYHGCLSGESFVNLERLELVKIPKLKKWVGNGTCDLFSHLEVLIIEDCSELEELPLSHATCFEPKKGVNTSWFPRLLEIKIVNCPKLLSPPPIPWTRGLCKARIERSGSAFDTLQFSRCKEQRTQLSITGKGDPDNTFWDRFPLYNLHDLEVLDMTKCCALTLDHLQMLTSLKVFEISDSSNVLSLVEGVSHAKCLLPVERIVINECGADGKELTELLSHCPKLTNLTILNCESITGLSAVEQQTTATPASANQIEHAQGGKRHGQPREEKEITAGGGLLLLPPQLHELWFVGCPNLVLLSSSPGDDNTGGIGGLHCLFSLRRLTIRPGCPKFLSLYPPTSYCSPFPSSLETLTLCGIEGMETLEPLANLTSLTKLYIRDCGDLIGKGIWPLLDQGRLTELGVMRTPKFFTDSEPPLSSSSNVLELGTNDVVGILAVPFPSLLSSMLTKLYFHSIEVERFTKEQEESLQLLAFLQELEFNSCEKLQCLPAGLDRLSSLKRLEICGCHAIRSISKDSLPSSLQKLLIWCCPAFTSLPKDGLPSSLQELQIWRCPAMTSLPKDVLPSSLQKLEILNCPAIKSLPKDGLPSSLRVLDIGSGNSEELKRQCHKLKGTIPIIKDYDD